MPLSNPPDHSKSILVLCVGLAIGVAVFSLTSYKGPTVGDNIHNLPFGGIYKDGTKSIVYNRPNRGGVVAVSNQKVVVFTFIFALIAFIYALEVSSRSVTRVNNNLPRACNH